MAEKSSKPCIICVACKKTGQKYYTYPNTSFHTFPSCPEKRQIWMNRCGLTDREVLRCSKICSFHFKPTCFNTKLKRHMLHRDAVPTIFVEDHVKKTNMPIKKNEEKPKNCNKNEIPFQSYDVCDVSVKVVDFLCYPPSDILLTSSAKKMIEKTCQTCDLHYEVVKEMNTFVRDAFDKDKKEMKETIMKLRKQVSSLESEIEKINNKTALYKAEYEAKIKKL
ncbi:THAP domain-containing protein 1-like [Aphis gossypii]|uniref:THAP-type domain-containing protein n=1 Tax=Aphis gossypii TaxID=80765 RepID=A0A9P0J8L7_APHGO|nr:THAP domain-containing protein 1-like [Aphis gossypii]CAH1732436.1 unnamed protein product [Aphis gossypii]